MSSIKVEEAAINAVKNLINLSDYMTSDEIKDGEKGVSFDGCIPLYIKEDLKKESFYNKIDIQVKGRSVKELSNAKNGNFSIEKSHLKNFKQVGGVLFFFVQITKDRKNSRIYIKSLLPYEINQLLTVNEKNSVSVKFEHIDNNDNEKLEYICFQFQKDKDKQYSYKDNYKTLEDFQKEKGIYSMGINIPTISSNPIEYLKRPNFIYFQPDNLKNLEIPCGMAIISSFIFKRKANVKIGNKIYDTYVEIKEDNNVTTVNINDCIEFNTYTNMFTFNLNTNMKKALYNINLIKDFIKAKSLLVNNNKLSIKEENDYTILNNQIEVIEKLRIIVEEMNVSVDPIIDFSDKKSIKNIGLVYNNIIDKIGIPFKIKYDAFMLKTKIFNIELSFSAKKRGDSTYDLIDITKMIKSEKNLFSYINEEKERVELYPNFSAFSKGFGLDVTYLLSDNVINELDKIYIDDSIILGNFVLETNLTWFILDALQYYDTHKNYQLLKFLEKISYILLKNDNADYIDIYKINYFQILKRSQKLTSEMCEDLIVVRDATKDTMIKVCISIILEDKNGYNVYYKKLSDSEKKTLMEYPIYNLIK